MDRSFLSDQAVVTASRQFVCARLATYEDSEESKFLRDLVDTRSGELENSVFAILDPDGKTPIGRKGRSMRMGYEDAAAFARGLDRIAARYPGTRKHVDLSLPVGANVPLALTVAAADDLPLVVLPPDTDAETMRKLSGLAWSPGLVGRFQYARLKAAKELEGVQGKFPGDLKDLLVVIPDPFAQGGTVAAVLKRGEPETWEPSLKKVVATHKSQEKAMRDHVREGRQKGVFYEPANPVTDPQELRARERNRPAKP